MVIKEGNTMNSNTFDYNSYYKKISPLYNEIRLDSSSDFKLTLDIILEFIHKGKEKLLDVGCGTGKYGQALMKKGVYVEGIDKSPSQIFEAQKVINAHEGNVINLPYKEKSFDVCIMIMMLHHLNQKERRLAFEEIYRVLKDDGMLIIKTASHEDLKYRISSRFFPEALQIDLERYPTIEVIQNELSKYKKITVKHTVSTSSFNKGEMLHKLSLRRTSNLGMLSDESLDQGINRFMQTYQNQEIIEKENHNTFIIVQK